MAAYEEECTNQLAYIVDLVRGNLTNLHRITLGNLPVLVLILLYH